MADPTAEVTDADDEQLEGDDELLVGSFSLNLKIRATHNFHLKEKLCIFEKK